MTEIADKGGRGSAKDMLLMDLADIEARMFPDGVLIELKTSSHNMPWPRAFEAFYRRSLDCVILDSLLDPLKEPLDHHTLLARQAHIPDWKSKIPEPNPFNRPLSSPSEKVRAKARAKRKKRK